MTSSLDKSKRLPAMQSLQLWHRSSNKLLSVIRLRAKKTEEMLGHERVREKSYTIEKKMEPMNVQKVMCNPFTVFKLLKLLARQQLASFCSTGWLSRQKDVDALSQAPAVLKPTTTRRNVRTRWVGMPRIFVPEPIRHLGIQLDRMRSKSKQRSRK